MLHHGMVPTMMLRAPFAGLAGLTGAFRSRSGVQQRAAGKPAGRTRLPRWRYISGLTDPQGLKAFKCPCLKALIRWPFQHSWCSWAKEIKTMKTNAARTHPATTFFIMAATPWATARPKMMNPWARLSMRRNPRTGRRHGE